MSDLIQRIEAYLDDPLRPVEFGIHLDLLREALAELKEASRHGKCIHDVIETSGNSIVCKVCGDTLIP